MPTIPAKKRKRAVFELHHHALERLLALGKIKQLKNHGLIFAEHFAAGDAEQQAVTNLAGGAGDCDTNRRFSHD